MDYKIIMNVGYKFVSLTAFDGIFPGIGFFLFDMYGITAFPVSYTHLDVYKRQPY